MTVHGGAGFGFVPCLSDNGGAVAMMTVLVARTRDATATPTAGERGAS